MMYGYGTTMDANGASHTYLPDTNKSTRTRQMNASNPQHEVAPPWKSRNASHWHLLDAFAKHGHVRRPQEMR